MTETATCRAAVFRTPGELLRIEEFPIPVLAGGEALVRIECWHTLRKRPAFGFRTSTGSGADDSRT